MTSQENKEKLLESLNNNRIRLLRFDVPKIDTEKKPKFVQTASNCWIYSVLNNLYLNTNILVDGKSFERFISWFGIDSKKWGFPLVSWSLLCEYIPSKEICRYEIDLIRKENQDKKIYQDKYFDKNAIKLFGRLLLQGLVFNYSRVSGDDIREDIKDNDTINRVLSKENDWRHATNIYFKNNKLHEIGTRSENSIYNEFSYETIAWFIKSIKEKTIRPTVRFLYYKQKRPYVDYKRKMLWSRVDYDKAYGYQCVDLFKDYMKNVLKIRCWKTGNANQIRYNTYNCFDENREQIKGTKDLMQWDILISLKWTYGHIGIFDRYAWGKICLLEQNWSWSPEANGTNWDEIREHFYDPSFFVWVWRNQTVSKNYQKEVSFIENKLFTKWNDKDTIDYERSIRYKI